MDFSKLRGMCDACGIAGGKQSDEYLFTLYAVDLFYYKTNIGKMDIKSGFTDGANDGGIDYIYSDGDTMYLIQGKSSDNLSQDDISSVFNKVANTISDFEDKDADNYSSVLKTAYQNAYDDLSDEKNIEIVLFTNTILDEKDRKRVENLSKAENLSSYKITVYDGNDINIQSAILNTGSELIPDGKIEIKLSGNGQNDMLAYGENGIIVNVMASSIKKLYEKYGKTGLFSYNLREYISQKTVDDGIDNTIKEEPDNFWYYNNGITIGCQDFMKDGNTIKLYGFSIINGAQTTTKIGKSKIINEKNDFALVCKIVKSEREDDDLDQDFIGKISEASNSQKPVKQRDLKANAKEQKILQNNSVENGKYQLAIEIKRGVRPINYKKVDKWKRVTNEYLGQLIYAGIFQHPGPARNSKNTMFSSNKLYTQIFKRKHDYDTLFDLVRIAAVYDEYKDEVSQGTDDVDQIALVKNGKLTVFALVLYLYKKRMGIIDDCYSDKLHKDNVKGLLVTDYAGDDLDKKLKEIFKFITRQLKTVYNNEKGKWKVTSYSNFFKSDQIYDSAICRHFDELDDYDIEKLNTYMSVFDLDKKKS